MIIFPLKHWSFVMFNDDLIFWVFGLHASLSLCSSPQCNRELSVSFNCCVLTESSRQHLPQGWRCCFELPFTCTHLVRGTMVQVLLKYPAMGLLHYKNTPGPSGGRGEMAMASVRAPVAFSVARSEPSCLSCTVAWCHHSSSLGTGRQASTF